MGQAAVVALNTGTGRAGARSGRRQWAAWCLTTNLLLLATTNHDAAAQRASAATVPTDIRDIACTAATGDGTPVVSAGPPSFAWRGSPVRWAEWAVRLGPRRVRSTLIVAEVDPTRTALALDIARDGDAMGPWTIDSAPADSHIALNAGQFSDEGPWGWVVHRGREWQPPGTGPLSAAVLVDSAGRVGIIGSRQIAAARARGGWIEALQSYPVLLEGGGVPPALCAAGAIDRTHRDIRLALGVRSNGRVLVVLSRYAGAGTAGARLPIGPTTLEMAEIMRRVGAVQAVMLDGGLSAQLLVRDAAGPHRWAGLRAVPLALVGRPVSPLAPASAAR